MAFILTPILILGLGCSNDNPVNGDEETISTPNRPSGPSSGQTGQSLSFSTGGASSSAGHSLQYRFDWGDGNYSGWSSSTNGSHSWAATETYSVKAQARCGSHKEKMSNWSSSKSVTISDPQESISTPNTPSGPSNGEVGQNLTYYTGGSTSNLGHSVQYQFDWGDGSGYSSWTSSTSASHSYSNPVTYYIEAHARCGTHTSVTSYWSNSKRVDIVSNVHEVNYPNGPSGPENGYVDSTYTYSTGGSSCTKGHPVQYRFVWGTGETSQWSNSNSASHSWSRTGAFYLGAQARCAVDTTVVSDWSLSMLVVHIEEPVCSFTITAPQYQDVWVEQTNQNITWSSSAAGTNVKIELYWSGSYWCDIVSSTPNDGLYQWNVNDCNGGTYTNYRIKITDLSDPSCYDFTNFFTISSTAGEYVYGASQDSYIYEGAQSTNFGGQYYLGVGTLEDGNEMYAYVQFDLNSIPQGSTVELAELTLNCVVEDSVHLVVRMVAQSWSEYAITWDNNPVSHTYPWSLIGVPQGTTSITVDVQELVQKWISGERQNYGFVFHFNPNPNGHYLDFASRDHSTSAYHPKLRVRHK